jgi:hypothetical protein
LILRSTPEPWWIFAERVRVGICERKGVVESRRLGGFLRKGEKVIMWERVIIKPLNCMMGIRRLYRKRRDKRIILIILYCISAPRFRYRYYCCVLYYINKFQQK